MRRLPFFLLACLFAGCTSTRTLAPDADGAERLLDNFGGQPVTVLRTDATSVYGRLAGARGDTLWVLPGTTDAVRADAIPLSDVVRVERVSARRGAIQGTYFGFLIGSPLAFYALLAEPDAGTLPLVLLGPAVGAAVGARKGARDVYRIVPED